MKIDLKNQSGNFAPSPKDKSGPQDKSQTFASALEKVLTPSPQRTQIPTGFSNIQHQNIPLNLNSSSFSQQTEAIQDEQMIEEQFIVTTTENKEETREFKQEIKEDIKQDEILDDSVENKAEMEELSEESSDNYEEMIEEFQEEGKELDEPKDHEKDLDGSEDAEDLTDDILDLEKEKEEKEKEEHADEKEIDINKQGSSREQAQLKLESRDMTFQEIQNLVDTVLSANKHLPSKVSHLLNRVLQSLLKGHRLPIDQHEMVGLEKRDWHLLADLFPPRFFGGFMRPIVTHAIHAEELDSHWELFQNLLYQRPLSQEQSLQLDLLYERVLPEYMLHQLLQKKEVPDAKDLKNWLEISQQRGLFLPGATGKAHELALGYTHNPETSQHLFQISATASQGNELQKDQQKQLVELLFERCFSHFAQEKQILPLLSKTMASKELDTKETWLLMQGSPQGILGFLPFQQVSPQLQELLELVYTDPNYSEDTLLQLLQADEVTAPEDKRRM